MAKIQSYELKNGQKRYMFQLYIGMDPLTGKGQQDEDLKLRKKLS